MTDNEIVLSYEDVLIKKSDLKLLTSKDWINDNLISFWFSYLSDQLKKNKIYYFNFIFPEIIQMVKCALDSEDMLKELKNILNKNQNTKNEIFFFPINDCDFFKSGGSHWSLLVYHKELSKFEHYDSLQSSSNEKHAQLVFHVLKNVFNLDDKVEFIESSCLKQINGFDCGIHLICNVEAMIKKLVGNDKRNLNNLVTLQNIQSKRKEIFDTINQLK